MEMDLCAILERARRGEERDASVQAHRGLEHSGWSENHSSLNFFAPECCEIYRCSLAGYGAFDGLSA
jgi:hypothetical protein